MLRQPFFFLLVAASSLLGQSSPAPPVQFEVHGTLMDSVSGQHLSVADVTLTSSDGREDPAQQKTDDEGNFLFSALKPGKYMLTAKRYGYISQAFDAHDGFFTAVVVGTGLDSSHVRFTIAPECSITGTVVDEAGEPIQEAKVLLYQTSRTGGMEQAKDRAGAETNDLGAFHFSHLPPGRYFVSVLARVWYAQRPAVKEAGT